MTKTCLNCQGENHLNSLFCEFCGNSLKEDVVETIVNSKENTIYEQGIKEFSSGNLESALILFQSINEYRDAQEKIALIKKIIVSKKEKQKKELEKSYQQAIEYFSTGRLEEAKMLFTKLSEYKDSLDKLQLIQSIILKQTQNFKEKEISQAFELGNKTESLVELDNIIIYLSERGVNEIEIQPFLDKQQRLQAEHLNGKKDRNKKITWITCTSLIIITTIGILFFVIQQQKKESEELAMAVTVQRNINLESFDLLESETQNQIKEMFSAYGAHVNDYSYQIEKETSDYVMIGYTFKGPDKSKDLLPKKDTRLYDQTALTRK